MEQMTNKIEIKQSDNAQILEIREGKAIELREPEILSISGQIDSVLRFLNQRNLEFNHKKANIQVNKETLNICLMVNEDNYYNTTINANLIISKIFDDFKINTGYKRSTFELADFIKMNRFYLESTSKAGELVSILKNFKAKVNKEVEDSNDNKGNRDIVRRQKVESNIPDSFKVEIPIFKGMPKTKIELEIYIDPDTFDCSLISPDANDRINETIDTIIDEQISIISEKYPEILIINV